MDAPRLFNYEIEEARRYVQGKGERMPPTNNHQRPTNDVYTTQFQGDGLQHDRTDAIFADEAGRNKPRK